VKPGADEKTELEKAIEYDTFAVGPVDLKATIKKGPYTALEGYLQVRRALKESNEFRTPFLECSS
jgi:hypothetical protein